MFFFPRITNNPISVFPNIASLCLTDNTTCKSFTKDSRYAWLFFFFFFINLLTLKTLISEADGGEEESEEVEADQSYDGKDERRDDPTGEHGG